MVAKKSMNDLVKGRNLPANVRIYCVHGGPPKEYVRRVFAFVATAARKHGFWPMRISVRVNGNGRRTKEQNTISHSQSAATGFGSKLELTLFIDISASRSTRCDDLFKLVTDHWLGTVVASKLKQEHQAAQPQLGIVWAMPPTPPKPRVKLTLVQKRARDAKKQLVLWKRRVTIAKNKVKECQTKVRYYEKKGVLSCDG